MQGCSFGCNVQQHCCEACGLGSVRSDTSSARPSRKVQLFRLSACAGFRAWDWVQILGFGAGPEVFACPQHSAALGSACKTRPDGGRSNTSGARLAGSGVEFVVSWVHDSHEGKHLVQTLDEA